MNWQGWILGFLGVFFSLPGFAQTPGKINFNRCTYRGFPLVGKVQIVENFPDLRVKIVGNSPDLKVEIVNIFPQRCGQWQFVEAFPDLKIKIVENSPDITIQFVKVFPGT